MKIPEDICEVAEKVWQPTSLECKQAIARAILAERKRCADVARKAGNTWSGSRDAMQCCQEAAVDDKCEEIAAAIESAQ